MPVNAVFFKYARLSSGDEILARSVLVAEEVGKVRGRRSRVTLSDLRQIAEERKVLPLLEACRS